MKVYGEVEVQLHEFLASVLDEVSGQLQAMGALPRRKEPPVPIRYEAELTPESVWTRWWRERSFPCLGRESNTGLHPVVLSLESCFYDRTDKREDTWIPWFKHHTILCVLNV
jgi:hypothetical protein